MKILPIAAAAQLILSSAAVMPQKAAAAAKVHHNNIVLFAQFEDVSEYNFMADRAEKIDRLCNAEGTVHSLAGYMDAVSYGQYSVKSYFPQLKDGVIVPYRMQHAREDYTNCDQYALEMLANITVPASIPLDGDKNGIVDNVILIVDGKAQDGADPIWAKEFSAYGAAINGMNVGTVNMQNSYQIFEDLLTGAEGVLCHEFLHSIGYPDLYRSGRSGVPVGQWDIMASNSVFVQYPLAYQRASVSGWLDWTDITQSGTYTLSPASSDSGERLYLLKTPLSNTEFFAVEYRKQGAKYSDEMDVKIYGSGLCVYRVNTEVYGNFKEERDQIYVFRPGETGIDNAAGEMTHSNFGGTNAPDHIGSLDWNDGITEGALVYSNGTNSGIMLTDISFNDEQLTFTVEFAERSEQMLWEAINTSAIKGLPRDMAVDEKGTPWLVAADRSSAQLYRINGDIPEEFGAPLKTGSIDQPKLEFCRGVPYLMYHDKDYFMCVSRFDPEKNSWTQVTRTDGIAQFADMTSDGEKLYFAYTSGNMPYRLEAGIYDPKKGSLEAVKPPVTDSVCNLSVACTDDEVLIGYRSLTDDSTPHLTVFGKLTQDGWIDRRLSDVPCSGISVAAEGSTALITPWGPGSGVYTYEDHDITGTVKDVPAAKNAFMQLPVMTGGKNCFMINGQQPEELALYALSGSGTEIVGDTISRDIANDLAAVYCGGYVYCSYFTSANTPVLKRLKLEDSPRLKGDVNADGSVDAADLVMLNNYLLGKVSLIDSSAAELCEDGSLNVFDLVLLRKLITEKM